MKRSIVGIAGLGLTLVAGALLPLGSAGNAHAAPSLASLALKRSDVPAGFKQVVGKSETIQDAAKNKKVSVATLRSKGWAGDYQDEFDKGNTGIQSSVGLFTNVSGAKWDFNAGLQRILKQYRGAKTFSVQGLGEQAAGIRLTTTSGKTQLAITIIGFRRGAYLASTTILVVGTTPPSASSVQHYAKVIDGRIKSA